MVIAALAVAAAAVGYFTWRAAADDGSAFPVAVDSMPAERPLESAGALERGNAAYRAGRFDSALAHYRSAVTSAPSSAAAHLGVYMTARQTGNTALADSARESVLGLVDTTQVPPDSLLRIPRDLARTP